MIEPVDGLGYENCRLQEALQRVRRNHMADMVNLHTATFWERLKFLFTSYCPVCDKERQVWE